LDGFRPDYLQHALSSPDAFPALRYFAEQGVVARSLTPVFPSKTFPNHYAIATGLFPAWNGIIDNAFLLRLNNGSRLQFTMSSTDPVFWKGEPIWLTAAKAGLRVWAGTWPGSSAPLPGWNVQQNSYGALHCGAAWNSFATLTLGRRILSRSIQQLSVRA
jgi:predicted AlkP superfamily phosphohydrolase/phosphomutase